MKKVIYICLGLSIIFIGHITFNAYRYVQESKLVKTNMVCFATEYRKSKTAFVYDVEVLNWFERTGETGSLDISNESTKRTSSYLHGVINKRFSLHNKNLGDLGLEWKTPSWSGSDGALNISKTEYIENEKVGKDLHFSGLRFTGTIKYKGYVPIDFYMACPKSYIEVIRETRMSKAKAFSLSIERPLSFYRYGKLFD